MNILLVNLANDPTRSAWQLQTGEELFLVIIAAVLLIGMILIGVLALNLLVILRKAVGPEPITKPADPRTRWQRMAGLHLLSQEKELMIDHPYDDIYELDNPTPPWFMGLFYGTIGFGIVYLLIFHVFDTGELQLEEYKQEVAIAEVQREAYIKKVAGSINENTVALATDAKSLESGKALYLQSCVACHGQQGQGGVGPNLTDEYWLHGSSIKSVYHVIAESVVEKGMMSWKKQLNPLQMQQVASFILSLQGTKPAGAKEAQGEKATPNVAVASDKVSMR